MIASSPWSLNLDRVIASVAALLTLAAIGIALFLPSHERSVERREDLKGYRNLICFVSRYLEGQLPNVEKTEDLKLYISPPVVEAMDVGLKAIQFSRIYPPELSEQFVDLIAQEKLVLFWANHSDKYHMNDLRSVIAAVHSDIAAIDKVVRDQGSDTNKMAPCGPSH